MPGLEVSGFIDGAPVAAYLPAFGGYAERVVADERFVYPADGLDLRVAAAAPVVATTAYGILTEAARLRTGETVLIHAAAGGVGSAAVQLARALGAGRVLGTVGSVDKLDYARSLGYDEVFLRDGFAGQVGPIDIVLDPVGGAVREASLGVLAPFGRLAVYGEAGRHPDLRLPVRDLWKNNRAVVGFNIGDLVRRAPEVVRRAGAAALALFAEGRLRIDVVAEYPLAEAAAAHRVMEAGAGRGKTVLKI